MTSYDVYMTFITIFIKIKQPFAWHIYFLVRHLRRYSDEQRHVLGYYSKISDDFQDYWNYKQNEPSSQHEKLWYNPSIQAWFIADFLGSMCI